ncbi:MAG: signal peptidase II [Longimicrobiales bacterium]|nr:signal peptidase II [Longimicrobiales bacterium]
MKKKSILLGTTVGVLLIADIWTKRWALETLGDGTRLELFGGLLPLTLAFNRGAAFGISIGDDPRWFFIPVTVLAVGLLSVLYAQAHEKDDLRLVSLALVMSGALGNLIDRVRWDRGVVDFLGPVDLGFMHWPIFNVADMAITCGAVLLAISFWMEEQRLARAGPEGESGADSATEGKGDERVDPSRVTDG